MAGAEEDFAECTPETVSSEVPAEVPSVTQRLLFALLSLPANSTLLPNTVRSVGLRPPPGALVDRISDVPPSAPFVAQRPCLLVKSTPANTTVPLSTVSWVGCKPPAPPVAISEVPSAVPSVAHSCSSPPLSSNP